MSSNVYRTLVWKIENFTKSPDRGRVSPTFKPVPGLQMNLELIFESPWAWYRRMKVAVSYSMLPGNVDMIHGKIICSNTKEKRCPPFESSFKLTKTIKQCILTVIDSIPYKMPDEINRLLKLHNDVLVIEVVLALSGQELPDAVDATSAVDTWKELAADLGEMYRSACQADVKFTFVDGRVLTAHRQILSARSPVFRRMFESDMLERNSDEVPIADFDADVFDHFLAFLYSGELADDVGFGSLCSLFSAADKYDVASLRTLCSRRMCSRISADNVGMILHLANLHSDSEAVQAAKEFIQKNL